MNKEKIYKSIMLPEKLHQKIKLEATKKGQSIIDYLSELLSKVK